MYIIKYTIVYKYILLLLIKKINIEIKYTFYEIVHILKYTMSVKNTMSVKTCISFDDIVNIVKSKIFSLFVICMIYVDICVALITTAFLHEDQCVFYSNN